MKKTLLFGVIAALAFALVFTGCQQAVDYKLNVGHDSLPSPNVTATKYEGGVLLTWDMVENASGYEVWRQQTSPTRGQAVQLDGSIGRTTPRYADVITFTNPLAADADYEYTVVAKSANATTGSSIGGEIVQNGKSTSSVHYEAADLPAKTFTVPAVTGVTLESDYQGRVYAKWAAGADNPLIRYEVLYTYDTTQSYTTLSYNTYAQVATAVTDVTVSVVAYLGDATYYAPSAAATASKTFTSKRAPSVTTVDPSTSRSGTSVLLTWTGTAGQTYEIAKAHFSTNSRIGAHTLLKDYTAVTPSYLIAKDSSGSYEALDPAGAVPEDESWVYRLVGKDSEGYIVSIGYATVNAQSQKQINSLHAKYTTHITAAKPGTAYNDAVYTLYLEYDTEPEVTYTVYRQTVGNVFGFSADGSITDTSSVNRGTWEVITSTTTKEAGANGSESIKYTITEPRQRANYKVVAVGTGSKAGYNDRTETIASNYAPIYPLVYDTGNPGPDQYKPLNSDTYNFGNLNLTTVGQIYDGAQISEDLYSLPIQSFTTNGRLLQNEKIVLKMRSTATSGQSNSYNWKVVATWQNGPSTTTYGVGNALTSPAGWNFSIPRASLGAGSADTNYEFTFEVTK